MAILDPPVPRDALRAARQIVRHFHHPHRLRDDAAVIRYLPALSADDASWRRSLHEAIRAAFARVPSRVRIAAERTALLGEPVAAVARSLGVSERQLYRDRAAATEALARFLAFGRSEPRVSSINEPRSFDFQLSYANALEQTGQLDAARTVLGDLRAEVSDERDRSHVLTRLARLLLAQGRVEQAQTEASLALLELGPDEADTLARSEAESALGEIALYKGEMSTARLALRRASVGFRSLLSERDRERACAGLVSAVLTLSDVKHEEGLYRESYDLTIEAERHLREMESANQSLNLAVRMGLARAASFMWLDPDLAEVETRACFDSALSQSFIKSAVELAIELALIYRFRGNAPKARDLLSSLLPIVQGFTACRTKVGFYLTFANALSEEIGRSDAASRVLAEAQRALGPDQPLLQGAMHLTEARVRLSAGDNELAIGATEDAAAVLSRLGRMGPIGVNFYLQSRAWEQLQRVSEARTAARLSVEALQVDGHHGALQKAQSTLYRLTGSRPPIRVR